MEGVAVGSASPGVRAQLLLGMLVCALFPVLCLLDVPPPTHAVTMDSLYLPATGDRPVWLRPAPPRAQRSARDDRTLPAVHGPLGPRHVVAVTAAGETLFDGCPVDGAGLRERVDALGMATEGWLDLRPEAEAPWPLVDEALATFAKAAVPAFRLDNAPFRHMNDAVAVYGEPKAPPPLPLGLAPTVRRPAADCAAEALVRIR